MRISNCFISKKCFSRHRQSCFSRHRQFEFKLNDGSLDRRCYSGGTAMSDVVFALWGSRACLLGQDNPCEASAYIYHTVFLLGKPLLLGVFKKFIHISQGLIGRYSLVFRKLSQNPMKSINSVFEELDCGLNYKSDCSLEKSDFWGGGVIGEWNLW